MADLDHHSDEPCNADAWVDAERREFWARIHRMSSASYKPTIGRGVFGHGWQVNQHSAPTKGNDTTRGYVDRQAR